MDATLINAPHCPSTLGFAYRQPVSTTATETVAARPCCRQSTTTTDNRCQLSVVDLTTKTKSLSNSRDCRLGCRKCRIAAIAGKIVGNKGYNHKFEKKGKKKVKKKVKNIKKIKRKKLKKRPNLGFSSASSSSAIAGGCRHSAGGSRR